MGACFGSLKSEERAERRRQKKQACGHGGEVARVRHERVKEVTVYEYRSDPYRPRSPEYAHRSSFHERSTESPEFGFRSSLHECSRESPAFENPYGNRSSLHERSRRSPERGHRPDLDERVRRLEEENVRMEQERQQDQERFRRIEIDQCYTNLLQQAQAREHALERVRAAHREEQQRLRQRRMMKRWSASAARVDDYADDYGYDSPPGYYCKSMPITGSSLTEMSNGKTAAFRSSQLNTYYGERSKGEDYPYVKRPSPDDDE